MRFSPNISPVKSPPMNTRGSSRANTTWKSARSISFGGSQTGIADYWLTRKKLEALVKLLVVKMKTPPLWVLVYTGVQFPAVRLVDSSTM